MKAWLTLFLVVLSATPATAAQLYRWVDDKGGVHYTDQPPPAGARKAQRLGGQGNVVETDKESFAMKRAREASPVALFVTACGVPCDQATAFLKERRIPYRAKNPEQVPEDAIELKKLIGALEVPVIQVGASHHKGFDTQAWDKLLTAAGYPLPPAP